MPFHTFVLSFATSSLKTTYCFGSIRKRPKKTQEHDTQQVQNENFRTRINVLLPVQLGVAVVPEEKYKKKHTHTHRHAKERNHAHPNQFTPGSHFVSVWHDDKRQINTHHITVCHNHRGVCPVGPSAGGYRWSSAHSPRQMVKVHNL